MQHKSSSTIYCMANCACWFPPWSAAFVWQRVKWHQTHFSQSNRQHREVSVSWTSTFLAPSCHHNWKKFRSRAPPSIRLSFPLLVSVVGRPFVQRRQQLWPPTATHQPWTTPAHTTFNCLIIIRVANKDEDGCTVIWNHSVSTNVFFKLWVMPPSWPSRPCWMPKTWKQHKL